jgi:sodium/hydrogen antiporter
VRMVPVAVALIGAGVDRAVRGLVRSTGLASLVFALLALEELGADADEAIRSHRPDCPPECPRARS